MFLNTHGCVPSVFMWNIFRGGFVTETLKPEWNLRTQRNPFVGMYFEVYMRPRRNAFWKKCPLSFPLSCIASSVMWPIAPTYPTRHVLYSNMVNSILMGEQWFRDLNDWLFCLATQGGWSVLYILRYPTTYALLLYGCAAAAFGVWRSHQLLLFAVRCTDLTEYPDMEYTLHYTVQAAHFIRISQEYEYEFAICRIISIDLVYYVVLRPCLMS